jgi:asparagine synthase (glutamine-hydrolysing)
MRFGASRRALRSISRALANALPAAHPKSTAARAKRFLRGVALSPEQRYASYLALFDHHSIRALYPHFSERQRRLVAQTYHRLRPGRDAAAAAAATDRLTYLPEDLLTKLDRASMLHALEVRSPFLDPELVTMAAGLSATEMFAGGPKRLLREAFAADLPSFVFRRKKMGFAVPIGQWLRKSLRPMMEDLLGARDSFASENFHRGAWQKMIHDHCADRADHSQRLYALLMLELWFRDR